MGLSLLGLPVRGARREPREPDLGERIRDLSQSYAEVTESYRRLSAHATLATRKAGGRPVSVVTGQDGVSRVVPR